MSKNKETSLTEASGRSSDVSSPMEQEPLRGKFSNKSVFLAAMQSFVAVHVKAACCHLMAV